MQKKFNFRHNGMGKKIDVVVEGMFTEEDANAFIGEYTGLVKSIKAETYELNFDCTKLAVTPATVAPMLQGCFQMYKEDGFKNVSFRIPSEKGMILKMQFNRLAKATGLKNFTIIE